MNNLIYLIFLTVLFLIAIIKIEIYLYLKSKEKVQEAIKAWQELKEAKQRLEDD